MALRPLQTLAPGTRLPLLSSERLPAALRAGRTVRARVRTDATGRLLVAVGRARLPLDTQLALRAGEQLTVRLVATAKGPALEIVTRRPAPSAPATLLLRQAIPRQRPLDELLLALSALRLQTQSWDALSAEQRQSVEEILARLATSARLQQAEGVRTALRDSGVLLEWLLARYPQAAEQIAQADLKARLLRLIARLRDRPASALATEIHNSPSGHKALLHNLLQQAEGALARLHLLQLQPMESADRLDLAFEIPLAHGDDTDNLYLRIRREADQDTAAQRTSDERERGWEVSLRFRFAGNEALAARLHITGRRAAVTWWTEDARLAAAVEAARPVLVEQLQALELEVSSVRCHATKAPLDRTDATCPRGGLIHETV